MPKVDGNGSLVIPKWFLIVTTVVIAPSVGGAAVWAYQMERQVAGVREEMAGQKATLELCVDRLDRVEDRLVTR